MPRNDRDDNETMTEPRGSALYEVLKGVDFERRDVTRLKAIDGWLDATDEIAELLLVIGSDGLARGATICLVGHTPRLSAARRRRPQLVGRRGLACRRRQAE